MAENKPGADVKGIFFRYKKPSFIGKDYVFSSELWIGDGKLEGSQVGSEYVKVVQEDLKGNLISYGLFEI